MILVNTDYISGKELDMLGLVKGSTIQSKNIGKDITQSFKTIVGGELKAYNEMMNDARALATKRMVEEAQQLGADAIVNIRYASAAVMAGAAGGMAYGTAGKFRENAFQGGALSRRLAQVCAQKPAENRLGVLLSWQVFVFLKQRTQKEVRCR